MITFYITYEELKLMPSSSNFICKALFILPMRNWNDSTPLKFTGHISYTFYITYEELKLNTISWIGAFLISFYITYEELKHDITSVGGIWACAFYITYEELKLKSYLHSSYKMLIFLYYLWGIETQWNCRLIKMYMNFLYYLWGIETINSKLRFSLGEYTFYITYEELKR